MRILHTADFHLGFRQFDRSTTGVNTGWKFGKNQREADVEQSCIALIDHAIELRPEAIVIGGDVFHIAHPSNNTIIFALDQFRRLTQALPTTPVIIASGNHDLPRTTESAAILDILRPLGIHIADREAQRFDFPDLNLSVLAVPDAPGMVRPPLVPNPAMRFNVLVLHGEVHGVPHVHGDRFGIEIPTDELNAPEWSYIGLGHWHVYQQMGPNCFYSGSIDYTSSNVWGELKDEKKFGLSGKGFIEQDLATGAHTFHLLPCSRDHLDLTLNATGMGPEELAQAILETCEDAHVDQTVARLVVYDCPRDIASAALRVDPKAMRQLKSRALNLQIDFRKPEVIVVGGRIGTRRRMQTLEQITDTFFRNRPLPADISLEAITRLSEGYLAQAKGDDPMLEERLKESVAQEAVA